MPWLFALLSSVFFMTSLVSAAPPPADVNDIVQQRRVRKLVPVENYQRFMATEIKQQNNV
jgi:hypothetical protein